MSSKEIDMSKLIFQNHQSELDEIVRVNHAGEYGAQRIYEGQLKFAKNRKQRELIYEMLKQEKKHYDYFNDQVKVRRVRPTALMPVWNICGYALGALSSIAGAKTAMLVTQGVEEVIEEHYQRQINYLQEHELEKDLLANIKKFRQEEIEHKHIAIENESENANFHSIIHKFVKTLCKTAIGMSKKI